jgi:hypothetical protein
VDEVGPRDPFVFEEQCPHLAHVSHFLRFTFLCIIVQLLLLVALV